MDKKIVDKQIYSYKRNHKNHDFVDVEKGKVKRDKNSYQKSLKKVDKIRNQIILDKDNEDTIDEYYNVLYESKTKNSNSKTHNKRYKDLSQHFK